MPAQMDARLERERQFHDERFEGGDSREHQKRFYWAIKDGTRCFDEAVEKASLNADVLEYGCGDAANHHRLGPLARTYTGIDISQAAISRLSQSHDYKNVQHFTMDAHTMTFPDGAFDLVYGSGIIHHLDTRLSSREICRVLRPAGKAIFWEPLGANPLINFYRMLAPTARTPDEHPLMPGDFQIMCEYFGKVELSFYGLSTIACIPLQNTKVSSALFAVAQGIDKMAFLVPGLKWLAWYARIECTEPKRIL